MSKTYVIKLNEQDVEALYMQLTGTLNSGRSLRDGVFQLWKQLDSLQDREPEEVIVYESNN